MSLHATQISASDADLGTNSQILFSLSNDTDFEIDERTGRIQSRRPFDYENERVFNLEIIAEDNTSYPLSDRATLTISISDINDNTPFFINFPSNVSYAEDLTVGSIIANISANDVDSGINREVHTT